MSCTGKGEERDQAGSWLLLGWLKLLCWDTVMAQFEVVKGYLVELEFNKIAQIGLKL